MRLVFAGTPEAALPSLRAVLASRHEVAAVVTRPAAPRGRGRKLTPSPVEGLAADVGLTVLTPASPRDPAFQAQLSDIAPDCCPVVAYGALLPQSALDIPLRGWVNLHFSVLPAWRGAAPVQRALLAGEEVTGATTFRIVQELDAGPTYGLLTETIRPDDTAGTLLERLADHGANLLVATLDGIADGTLHERPQPAEGVSLAPKLTGDEARVRWNETAIAVNRRVRACTPSPGAFTHLAGARLKVDPVRIRPTAPALTAGELAVSKNSVLVGTGTHPVELGRVQPQGKASMPAADWARGLRGGPPVLGR